VAAPTSTIRNKRRTITPYSIGNVDVLSQFSTYRAMCAKPSIKAGVESRRKKQAAPELSAAALRDKLWRIGSPFLLTEYAPPLTKIAADLASRLERELAVCTSRASAAAELEYAGCAAHLMRVAPRVYDVLTEIRGLALIKNPDLTVGRPPADTSACEETDVEKEALPGEVLVYESLRHPHLSAP
jgi:hypothetical protein